MDGAQKPRTRLGKSTKTHRMEWPSMPRQVSRAGSTTRFSFAPLTSICYSILEPTRGRARETTSNSRSVQAKTSTTKRAHDDTFEDLPHSVELATPQTKRSRQNMSTTAARSASSQILTIPPQFPIAQPIPPMNQESTFPGGFIDPRQLDGFGFWYLGKLKLQS